jgi:VWFA-related protein
VSGLTREDFTVLEHGEAAEITNFEALHLGSEGAEDSRHKNHVTVIFDNSSLQKRNRRRVLRSLEPVVRTWTARDDRIMVAAANPDLEVVTAYTAEEEEILAALAHMVDAPTAGEALKSSKRMLRRSIVGARTRRAQVEGSPSFGSSSSSGGLPGSNQGDGSQSSIFGSTDLGMEQDFGVAQGRHYLNQLSILRRQEYVRIRGALVALEELVRSLSGLPGRKTVVFVGEDLSLRPGLDLYRLFYDKFEARREQLNLVDPELWGQELRLMREFSLLAASAQAAGTTLYVIDASDRDREMSNVDFSAPDAQSFFSTDSASLTTTGSYDLATSRAMIDGSQFLAAATGGTVFAGSRDFERCFGDLDSQLGSYYSIGYRRPGEPDGALHSVQVKVGRSGLTVRHHEKVPNPTPYQKLADLTLSRLKLDLGDNPLRFRVSVGDPQAAEDERVIQPISVTIPASELLLMPEGEVHSGQIAVVVLVQQEDGTTTPPQLMLFPIQLPADRLTPVSLARATMRLLLDPGSRRLAVGVRDERSGIMATGALDMSGV